MLSKANEQEKLCMNFRSIVDALILMEMNAAPVQAGSQNHSNQLVLGEGLGTGSSSNSSDSIASQLIKAFNDDDYSEGFISRLRENKCLISFYNAGFREKEKIRSAVRKKISVKGFSFPGNLAKKVNSLSSLFKAQFKELIYFSESADQMKYAAYQCYRFVAVLKLAQQQAKVDQFNDSKSDSGDVNKQHIENYFSFFASDLILKWSSLTLTQAKNVRYFLEKTLELFQGSSLKINLSLASIMSESNGVSDQKVQAAARTNQTDLIKSHVLSVVEAGDVSKFKKIKDFCKHRDGHVSKAVYDVLIEHQKLNDKDNEFKTEIVRFMEGLFFSNLYDKNGVCQRLLKKLPDFIRLIQGGYKSSIFENSGGSLVPKEKYKFLLQDDHNPSSRENTNNPPLSPYRGEKANEESSQPRDVEEKEDSGENSDSEKEYSEENKDSEGSEEVGDRQNQIENQPSQSPSQANRTPGSSDVGQMDLGQPPQSPSQEHQRSGSSSVGQRSLSQKSPPRRKEGRTWPFGNEKKNTSEQDHHDNRSHKKSGCVIS